MSLFPSDDALYLDNPTVPRISSNQIPHFPVLPDPDPVSAPPPPPPPPADPKKRHTCPTCSRAFTTSGHLARHIRVHTGERNHKCPFPGCETRCSRQDNLQQHYRIHLSPGSRRASSRRTERKKSALSNSTSPDQTPSPVPSASPATSARDPSSRVPSPPDSPPPLARAPVLPHYPPYPSPITPSTATSITPPHSATFPGSSPGTSAEGSASSTSSPRDSPATSPFVNVLGLSHDHHHAHHSPSAAFYQAHQQQQHHSLYSPYSLPPLPTPPTLPPIHALHTGFHEPSNHALARTPPPPLLHLQSQLAYPASPNHYSAGMEASSSAPTSSAWSHHDTLHDTSSYSSALQNWWSPLSANAATTSLPVSRTTYAQGYAS